MRVPRQILLVSLHPEMAGGVGTMRGAMERALRAGGCEIHNLYSRTGASGSWRWRLDPRFLASPELGDGAMTAWGLPLFEYAKYWPIGWLARPRLRERFDAVQAVGGSSATGAVGLAMGLPNRVWMATPYREEVSSKVAAGDRARSTRLNHRFAPLNDLLEGAILRRAGHVFYLSRYTRRVASERHGLTPARSSLLYPPIDLNRFRPRPRQAGPRYLLAAGRVEDPRKGMDRLARCLPILWKAMPDLELHIAGDAGSAHDPGPVRAALARLGARVRFLGVLAPDALAGAYAGACAFVLPSRQEGLGIVAAEAMASGTPTVAMRCGGVDELLEDGVAGKLCEPAPDAFAEALLEVLEGATEIWRDRCRARAENLFGERVFAERVWAAPWG